jgi:hypothetical protein
LKNVIIILAPADIPRLNEVDVSGGVLFFACLNAEGISKEDP